jgi:hypothetical protein
MKSGGFAPNKEENTSRTNKRKTEDSDEALRRAENDFFYIMEQISSLYICWLIEFENPLCLSDYKT